MEPRWNVHWARLYHRPVSHYQAGVVSPYFHHYCNGNRRRQSRLAAAVQIDPLRNNESVPSYRRIPDPLPGSIR